MRRLQRPLLAGWLCLIVGCGKVLLPDAGGVLADAGFADAEPADSGAVDTGPEDAGPADSGAVDTGPADTGPKDTGPEDTGPEDTGPADTGPADTGPPAPVTVRLHLNGTGSVTGPGMTCNTDCSFAVSPGQSLDLTAVAAPHWQFDAWSDATCGSATCRVMPSADIDLEVTFVRRTYALSVTLSGVGAGEVASAPLGFSCTTGTCLADVTSETLVTLSAVPGASSHFVAWTGDCVGTGLTCAVRMDQTRFVTATFDQTVVLAPLQVFREGDGAADGIIQGAAGAIACPSQCATSVATGTQVTLNAATSINTTVFTAWAAGPCAGQGAMCTFTMSAGLPAVRAEFRINELTVSVQGAPGRVTSSVGGIDCGATCQSVLPAGTAVVLTAIPATADERFSGWSGACTGSAPTCPLTLDAPTQATATFIVRPPPITNHQAADLVLGQPNFNTDLPNNGGESISTLNQPRYCHSDGTRLWVGDGANGRVLQWNSLPVQPFMQPANVVIGQASPTQHAYGVSQSVLDERPGNIGVINGRVYVADFMNSRILMWNAIPTGNGEAAQAVLGQTQFSSGLGGLSGGRYDRPYTLSASGNRLFVVDTFNHRILGYNSAPIATGLANADFVLGQFDGSGNPSFTQKLNPAPPTAASMHYPFDAVHDPVTDSFFVADTNNNRILGWTSLPDPARPADFVLGQTQFTSGAADAGQSGPNPVGLNAPRTLYVTHGSLFVADAGNNRVLVWTPMPSSTGEPASGVLGQTDLVSRGTGGDASSLSGPWGICGTSSHLFVVDLSDNRVLRYALSP